MGDSNRFRSVSGHYWRTTDLGPRTSRAVLLDIYQTAMAQLVGERRIHYWRLLVGAGTSFCRELARVDFGAALVDDSGNPPVGRDRDLHCLPFRTSEGAGYVAKPALATSSVC